MKKRTIIIAAVVVVAGLAVAALVLRARSDKPLEVQTSEASRQKVVQKANATGKVQPKTQVKISADVSARIMRLGVKEGDRVEQGQFLVELDREAYLAAVERAQANVRSAEANARLVREGMLQAEREFNRAKECNPRYMPARLHLGITYYSQGFFGLAEEEWQEALVFDPGISAVRTYLNFVKPQNA